MRKLLLIAADQERLGARAGAHVFKVAHEALLKEAASKEIAVIVATPEEAKAHYADAEIVAAFPMRMPKLEELPQARWLHSFSAGVDKILTPEMAKSDVLLTNSSGVHATPIAEMILAYLLMFARGFARTIREQAQHVWKKNDRSTELRDATVLIVGLGAIGTETARLCHAFGMHVWALRRNSGQATKKPEYVERLEAGEKLDELLPHADYVVITLPHTKETHYLFDRSKFERMKKTAVIVNIGRGGIIKESDLIDALKAGQIAGAALDVFEHEPLPADSPLWDLQNVIITPHHSGLSLRYMDRAIEVLCENLRAYAREERLPNEVDKHLGY